MTPGFTLLLKCDRIDLVNEREVDIVKKIKKLLPVFMCMLVFLNTFSFVKIYASSYGAYDRAKENLNELLKEKTSAYNKDLKTKKVLSVKAAERENKDGSDEASKRLIICLRESSVLDKSANGKLVLSDFQKENIYERVKKAATSVERRMRELNIKFTSLREKTLTDTIFASFTVIIDSDDIKGCIDKIKALDEVSEVQLSERYEAPEIPDYGKVMLFASNSLIHSQNFWDDKYKGEGQLVGILDTGADLNHKDLRLDDEALKSVKLTKEDVDRFRDEGLKGKYKSPKIPYYYNYQDSTDDEASLYDSAGSRHGLHVAGIVGANGLNNGIKGVAPNAQLAIFKVFSRDFSIPFTYTDAQVKAVDDAVKIGCDAINLSLGARSGFVNEDNMISRALKRAADSGCLVAVAAGNDGNSYTFGRFGDNIYGMNNPYPENPDRSCVAQPGTAARASTVASCDNQESGYSYAVFEKEDSEISMSISYSIDAEPQNMLCENADDMIYVGEVLKKNKGAIKEDEIFSAKKGALHDKIAIADRGSNEVSLWKKAEALKKEGIKFLIIVNSDSDASLPVLSGLPEGLPAVLTTYSDGNEIKEALVNGSFKKFSISASSIASSDISYANMSYFSSWGTAPDLSFKPEITAPGGNITSLDEGGGYQAMSGTSMATPHVAGAAAITAQFLKDKNCVFHDLAKFKEGYDNVKEDVIKLLLMNTAKPQKQNPEGEEVFYPVRRQGAGLVDLASLINQKVLARAWGGKDKIRDGKIEYKDTQAKKLYMTVNLSNYGDEDVEYKIDLSMMRDVISRNMRGRVLLPFMTNMNFRSSVQGATVKVPKNKSIDVKIDMDFSDEDIQKEAFVEGFIQFKLKSGEASDISVPYLAFYGDWSKPQLFDNFSNQTDENTKAQLYDDSYNPVTAITSSYFGGQAVKSIKYLNENAYVYGPLMCDESKNEYTAIRYALLRNADSLTFELLDENMNFKEFLFEDTLIRRMHQGAYDGIYYNGKLRSYGEVEKKMYVRLKGKMNGVYENAEKEKTAAVLYDGIKPVISEEKIIKEGDKTYAVFKVSDNTAIYAVGASSFDEEGNLGKSVYYSDSYPEIGFENGKKEMTVKIDVSDIIGMKNIMVYTQDYAMNISSADLKGVKDSEEFVNVKIEKNKGISVHFRNKDKAETVKTEDFKITKGTEGEIRVKCPDGYDLAKLYALETVIKGSDVSEEENELYPYFDDAKGVYTVKYDFERNVTLKAEFSEIQVSEPADPVIYKTPGIVIKSPPQGGVVSDEGASSGISFIDKEGKLNILGYVTHYDFKKIKRIRGEFINQHDDDRIEGSEIVYFDNTKVERLVIKKGFEVKYDAKALKFEGKHKVPDNVATCRYKVTVTYYDEDGQEKETSGTSLVWLDRSIPNLSLRVLQRRLSSSLCTMEINMSDDNLGNYLKVYKSSKDGNVQVYAVSVDLEEFTYISSNNIIQKTLTLDLDEGENIFIVEVSEKGTSRKSVKTIRLYRAYISLLRPLQ